MNQDLPNRAPEGRAQERLQRWAAKPEKGRPPGVCTVRDWIAAHRMPFFTLWGPEQPLADAVGLLRSAAHRDSVDLGITIDGDFREVLLYDAFLRFTRGESLFRAQIFALVKEGMVDGGEAYDWCEERWNWDYLRGRGPGSET